MTVYDTMARGFLPVSNKVLDLGLKPVGNYITIADTDAITIMLLCQEGRVVGSVDHKKTFAGVLKLLVQFCAVRLLVFAILGLRVVLACWAGDSPVVDVSPSLRDPKSDPFGPRIAKWSSGMTFVAISCRWAAASAFSRPH